MKFLFVVLAMAFSLSSIASSKCSVYIRPIELKADSLLNDTAHDENEATKEIYAHLPEELKKKNLTLVESEDQARLVVSQAGATLRKNTFRSLLVNVKVFDSATSELAEFQKVTLVVRKPQVLKTLRSALEDLPSCH